MNLDLPLQLGLEDTLGVIPIKNNVHQKSDVLESGGLSQWAFGGSTEIARNLWFGVSFNILTGSYEWQRTFVETDPNNLHGGVIAGKDYDRQGFQSVSIDENLQQDISGWNAKFGMLYNLNDKARFGLTIKTPSLVSINENYSIGGTAVFSNATENATITYDPKDYGITTAWVFGFGASYSPVSFATLSADLEFTDYSQMQYDNVEMGNPDHNNFLANNADIKKNLQSTNNYRIGVEVNIPGTGLFLRGGFGKTLSPYKDALADENITSISAGIGYLFENTVQLNIGFVSSKYKISYSNYVDPDPLVPANATQTYNDIANTNLFFSLAYRF